MYAYSVTPNFTEFFKLPLLAGYLHQTLLSSNEIAVTRSFALQYFGIANPIGKSITLGHSIRHFDGKENTYKTIFKSYTITTVIDDSQKSFLHYGILRGLPDEEVSQITGFPFYTFIELTPEITVQKFLAKINDRNEGQFEDITSDLSLSDLYAGYTPLVLILLLGTIIIIPPLYVCLLYTSQGADRHAGTTGEGLPDGGDQGVPRREGRAVQDRLGVHDYRPSQYPDGTDVPSKPATRRGGRIDTDSQRYFLPKHGGTMDIRCLLYTSRCV